MDMDMDKDMNMDTYYTLVVKTDGKWSPQHGGYDLEDVEDEKMEWDDTLYDVNGTSYSPNDIKIITTSEWQPHIDIAVMKLNKVKTVEVEYLMEGEAWNDGTEHLALDEYIDEMEKLNMGVYHCDAWIKVVSTAI